MTILIDYLTFTLTFLLGFFIGRKGFTFQEKTQLKTTLGKFVSRTERVGVIRTPTASQIAENKNPLVKGAKDAMREDLAKIPELQRTIY